MGTKTKLTIGAIITLLLAMSGTYFIAQDDDAYFCESKDMVMLCEKLSSGLGTRCYFFSEELNRTTYKICKEGWVKFESLEFEPKSYGKEYLCNQIECVEI